jgi:MFS family permease
MSSVQNESHSLENGREASRGDHKAVPLWRNRDFLLLLSGQGISSAGSQLSLIAFPLLMLALTHSPEQAGFMSAVRGLPYWLLSLPAGALVDRWNRKLTMILCDSGRALALGSIPFAFALGHLTYLQLYLVSLIEGTLFVFFYLAETATIPHVVAKEQITTATGQNEVLFSLANLLGPAFAPILYGVGRVFPFLADAVSYAVSVCTLCFIKTQFQGERVAQKLHLWKDIREGVSWLWHHKLLRFIAILTFGLNTPCTGYILILIVLAQHMHAPNAYVGLIFAGGGIGSIIGALIAAPLQKRFGFSRLMMVTPWIWAISWLLFAVAPNPFVLAVNNAISFIVVPVYTVVQYGYRLAVIPDQLLGRVNSVYRLMAFSGQPIGIALTGVLLQAFGPVPTILLLFIPQGVLCIAVVFNKHVRNAPEVR